MKKIIKASKYKKSFFKKIDDFIDDFWIVTCPECKTRALFEAYLSDKKNRLYLRCNYCGTIYISPPKKVKKQK
jgi:hypothetical protein